MRFERERLSKAVKQRVSRAFRSPRAPAKAGTDTKPERRLDWPVDEYLDAYARQIAERVSQGESCLLIGVLGAGKSEVLRRAAITLRNRQAEIVRIDIGPEPQLGPKGMWLHTARQILPKSDVAALESADDAQAAARNAIRTWMQKSGRLLVLMLDQVELLERSGPIFAELRWMLQQAAATAEIAGFAIVLASTETLRRDITSPHSPLHNMLAHIDMHDCAPNVREPYWRRVLTGVPEEQLPPLFNAVDELCAGDPYLMQRVAQTVRDALDAAPPADAALAIQQSLTAIKTNPAQTAPLLTRYAELVEDDVEATLLTIDLLRQREQPREIQRERLSAHSACVWGGVFTGAHSDSDANVASSVTNAKSTSRVWRFRNQLTQLYFAREFGRRPDRMTRALTRHQRYQDAIRFLATYRDKGYELTSQLRDVFVNWVRNAYSPSQAWDIATNALTLWFGDGATVLRFDARRHAAGQSPYLRVRPNSLDLPADERMARQARWAFKQRRAEAVPERVALKPITTQPSTPNDSQLYVFPFTQRGAEFGALMLSDEAHAREFDVPRAQDHIDAWVNLLEATFGEIAGFERQLLTSVNLALVQRAAQEHRTVEDTDWVLWMILSTITSEFGLKFDRCALLTRTSGSRLAGKCAIGYFDLDNHERAAQHPQPASFEDWLEAHSTAKEQLAPSARTPMGDAVDRVVVENWHNDPALSRMATSEAVVSLERKSLTGSALEHLLHVESAHDPVGEHNNLVLLVPLRNSDSAELLDGVLAVDKPFSTPEITQEQLDLLLSLSGQVLLTLQNDEAQRQRRLFNDLSAITLKPLSLQETLDEARAVLFEHLGRQLSQLIITSWEEHHEANRGPNRRQSTVRVAYSAKRGDLLGGQWPYFYYTGDEAGLGPIDEALRKPDHTLAIDDLPAWLSETPQAFAPSYTDGIRSVVSVALDSGTDIPRGVISFQSAFAHAFNDDDRRLFERIAQRVANVSEKARQFEGLSRARAHTEQLDRALRTLMEQKTRGDLHRFIVQQVSELFVSGGVRSEQAIGPDSAALFQIAHQSLGERLEGQNAALADQLAHSCTRMLASVLKTGEPVFVEYACKELLAREAFGRDECALHSSIGAEASAWVRIGDDLLLVMGWQAPRRINQRERSTLPVLAAIVARTNGVIEAEREIMREQLSTSLRVEDYDLIEAEQTHQWHRRIRNIKNNAAWAMEAFADKPVDEAIAYADERLRRIITLAREGEERLAYGTIKRVERVQLKPWLQERVDEWNMLHRLDNVQCTVKVDDIDENATLETRPVILRWVLHELLNNANEAEQNSLTKGQVVLAAHRVADTREYELSLTNPTPIPADVLTAINSRTPVDRRDKRGRGVWIVGQQVTNLLGGKFGVPQPGDKQTRFTIALPTEMEATR